MKKYKRQLFKDYKKNKVWITSWKKLYLISGKFSLDIEEEEQLSKIKI